MDKMSGIYEVISRLKIKFSKDIRIAKQGL